MKVSLVMSVYNGEEYLREAIAGILAQTYPSLEIIIVNNCSTDSTSTILSEINDERVKVIHLDANEGAANALNVGIAQAEGEWIAIHDADDISLPYRIEEQVAYLQNNPHLIAVGSFIESIAGNNISDSMIAYMKNVERYKNSIISWEQIREDLFKGCPYTHGSLLISKEAILSAGKYNPEYKIAYDYDLLARLANIGPIDNVRKVLYKYRISPNSLSNSNVLETSNEFLSASTKYIRNYCFSYIEDKPNVIVYGTREGSEAFRELMLNNGSFNVIGMIFDYEKEEVLKAYRDFEKREIDAFIILSNAPQEEKFEELLIEKGLKLNKDFFTLWSAI